MLSKNTKRLIAVGISLSTLIGSSPLIISPVTVYANEDGSEAQTEFSNSKENLTDILDEYEYSESTERENIDLILTAFSYETTTGSAVTIKAKVGDNFSNDGSTCSFDVVLYDKDDESSSLEFSCSYQYNNTIMQTMPLVLNESTPATWTSIISLTNNNDTVNINGVKFMLSDKANKSVEITGHTSGISADLILPSVITCNNVDYSVTSIGNFAFNGCSQLTTVEIPNSVTSIGAFTFNGCTGLTSIEIPNSMTSIGMGAFQGCSGLTSIEIPSSVTSIEAFTFISCTGLTSIEIPNSVTSIGNNAFSECTGLTSVKIPNSVTSIALATFYRCSGLTSIEIPNSVTTIEEYAFTLCSGLRSVKIPSSVTSIEASTFSSCTGLTSIEIPNSVTSIGNYAFSECTGLKSIEISNSVTSIGSGAFALCSGLTSIEIPSSVTSIEFGTFSSCGGLTSIEIPNSVTSIGNYAFKSSGLTSVDIPNSVTSIGEGAFFECIGLTSIDIPSSVTSIGKSAFEFCPDTTLYIVYDHAAKQKLVESNLGKNFNIKIQTLDKSKLSELYNTNKGIMKGNYTDESYNIFKEALDNAERVLNSTNPPTQTKVDATEKQLQKAIAGLKTATVTVAGITVLGEGTISQSSGSIILTVTVSPEDTTNKDVTWSITGGSEIASLSETGVLTARKNGNGTVVVRATAKDGSNVYGEKIITISNNEKESSSGGGSSSGGRSSSSSNDKIETTRIIQSSTDESGIIDALNTITIRTVIVIFNDSNENVANNTKILSQRVLTSLKGSIDKTLIIKSGNSSIEIRGTADGQIQITQKNVPRAGFNTVGNAEYYLNSNGIMQKGWINPVGNTWYHLNTDTGVKETNWIQDTTGDWYYLDNASGVMRTGWVNLNNTWYYLKSNGAMKTGWVQDGTKWYYLNSNGSMATNSTIDGYYVDGSGSWVK